MPKLSRSHFNQNPTVICTGDTPENHLENDAIYRGAVKRYMYLKTINPSCWTRDDRRLVEMLENITKQRRL